MTFELAVDHAEDIVNDFQLESLLEDIKDANPIQVFLISLLARGYKWSELGRCVTILIFSKNCFPPLDYFR